MNTCDLIAIHRYIEERLVEMRKKETIKLHIVSASIFLGTIFLLIMSMFLLMEFWSYTDYSLIELIPFIFIQIFIDLVIIMFSDTILQNYIEKKRLDIKYDLIHEKERLEKLFINP